MSDVELREAQYMKLILGIAFYFCAILLLVYFFVGVSFIKAIHLLIDRFYKRIERLKGRSQM